MQVSRAKDLKSKPTNLASLILPNKGKMQEELVLTPEEDAEIDKLLNKLFDMAILELQEERASANS